LFLHRQHHDLSSSTTHKQYISETPCSQPTVIGIEVVTNCSLSPLTAKFFIQHTGTKNPASDIQNADIGTLAQ
jgi:hypothetical protein